MKLFIRAAKLIDRSSPFHNQQVDIHILNGKIEKIGKQLKAPENTPTFKADNLHVSAGWFDLHANFADPGYEHKETIQSGIKAAAVGGFTGVALSPATLPVVDSKSLVEYINNQSKGTAVTIHPKATVSKGMDGKELAELHDMSSSGAVAFSDDKKSVQNPNLLKTALLYCKSFNGLVMQYPNQFDLSYKGMMHEGEESTHLGLKGIPAIAEEIMVNRDIYLTDYTEGRLHFSTISTSGSVDLIKEAKKNSIAITADVCALNLLLEDKELEEFDTRFKLMPPLRDKKHISDPVLEWSLEKQTVVSKSKNSPLFGRKLIGKPLGIINNNQSTLPKK